jgi:hypothetical protein
MYCPNPECPDARTAGSPGEYRPGVDHCPKCGTKLCSEPPVFENDPRSDVVPEDGTDFVSLGRLEDRSVIPAVDAALREANIRHLIRRREALSQTYWGQGTQFNPAADDAELLVEPGRVNEARTLMSEIFSANAAEDGLEEVAPGIDEAETTDERTSVLKLLRNEHRGNWIGRQFRAPPSAARVVILLGIVAFLVGLAIRNRFDSDRIAAISGVAVLLLLVAFDQIRRLRAARRGSPLATVVLCPQCGARIKLSTTERWTRSFSCPTCCEIFEVEE